MQVISLLSGGLDSVVATWAAHRQHQLVLSLTFNYGQRAAQRESQAARQIADKLSCAHHVIELPWLGQLGASALTDRQQPVPVVSEEELNNYQAAQQRARAVWVPNRNGIFLSISAAYCDALDCGGIVCGFNAEEATTFPDNSPQFIQAAENFFTYSTGRHLKVLAPTVDLTKTQIVQLGQELGAPLHLVWSCYLGGDQHCWQCESCLRLRRALIESGIWESWQQKRRTGEY